MTAIRGGTMSFEALRRETRCWNRQLQGQTLPAQYRRHESKCHKDSLAEDAVECEGSGEVRPS